jgi:hypothetical protein
MERNTLKMETYSKSGINLSKYYGFYKITRFTCHYSRKYKELWLHIQGDYFVFRK